MEILIHFPTISPFYLLAQYVVVTVCLKAGLDTLSWNKVSIFWVVPQSSIVVCMLIYFLSFGK